MHRALRVFAGLAVVVLGAAEGVLAFDAPVRPPPLASISDAFAEVDFSSLPTVKTYAARDGIRLGCRIYEGDAAQVVVLIRGSSDDGSGMHPLARALRDAGAPVYVPVLRGHGNFGRGGDIDHIGQLEDDLADGSEHRRWTKRPVHAKSGSDVDLPRLVKYTSNFKYLDGE